MTDVILTGALQQASGTSFASPVVDGVAALLLAEDPTLTPSEVRATLIERLTKDAIVGLSSDHDRIVCNLPPTHDAAP